MRSKVFKEEKMSESVEIILRTLVAFCWLWSFTLLIGKQFLTHSTYHLFVVSAILGTISGNMAFNTKIPFVYFLLSMFVISILGYSLMLISLKNKKARKWISGEPLMLIKEGNVLEQNMRKANFSLDFLKQGLRNKEIFDLSEVDLAILETSGTLSVLKKTCYRNATKQDLFEWSMNHNLPVVLIAEGKIVDDHLLQLGIYQDWLWTELSRRKIKRNDVFYAVLSKNGQLFFFGKESCL
jgi:uncharacterized membrane protein YcaP (DUF421 family)